MKGITESRLLKEKKVNMNGYENFYIQPLPKNLYEWHFTLKGAEGSVYEGGLYHGYFQIPKDYPLAPPNIYFLNRSGRYEINKKICMNITSYHKEEWTPAWTLRTMMQAIGAHFIGTYYFIQFNQKWRTGESEVVKIHPKIGRKWPRKV